MGSVKAEIIKLGCLRFNGKPVSPGVRYNMETISFGDTDPEKAISFVKWKNLLVADRCIFTSISWNDLNHSGLIFGRPVKIDGDPYICRSLRVGKEEGSSNEWDAILDDLEESDDLWHWDYIYFWGQENEKKYGIESCGSGVSLGPQLGHHQCYVSGRACRFSPRLGTSAP